MAPPPSMAIEVPVEWAPRNVELMAKTELHVELEDTATAEGGVL